MDKDRRDLIDHLGAELAGVMEDASVDAALLRRIEPDKLSAVIHELAAAAERAKALTAAMQALVRKR